MFQFVLSLTLWTLLVWGLLGCSAYDTKSTVQVYSYPPPKISGLSITKSGVIMTVTSGMYFPSHEDFNYYIILSGPSGTTDFQSDINDAPMGDFTSVREIPNYLAQTSKPSVSGSYLNAITVTINLSNFQSLETYDFTAIAYGYNESYGRLYENNGWLYSKATTSHTLHIPIITNGTIREHQTLVINDDKWKVSDNTFIDDSLAFVFATNINSEQYNVMIVRGNVGISPLGYVSGETILPVDYYVDDKTDNYFVVVSEHSYALKNLLKNTYARLVISSVNSTTITFQLFYSTTPNQRKF